MYWRHERRRAFFLNDRPTKAACGSHEESSEYRRCLVNARPRSIWSMTRLAMLMGYVRNSFQLRLRRVFSNCWRNGKWQERRAGKWERSISKALRAKVPELLIIARRAKKRGLPNWIHLLAAFTVTGEWQEQATNEAMLIWLKRFSDNADVEKARAEFERCSKGRFAGIGPLAGRGMVRPLRRQCENDLIDRYSRMLALVIIPMGRKKFDAVIFA
jgi:hypothetical protein